MTAPDVSPRLERKPAAVFAHRSEVARDALPGRPAAAAPADRVRRAGTERYQEVPPPDAPAGRAPRPRGTSRRPGHVPPPGGLTRHFREAKVSETI